MRVVARDGRPLGSAEFDCDTLGVNPGERCDVGRSPRSARASGPSTATSCPTSRARTGCSAWSPRSSSCPRPDGRRRDRQGPRHRARKGASGRVRARDHGHGAHRDHPPRHRRLRRVGRPPRTRRSTSPRASAGGSSCSRVGLGRAVRRGRRASSPSRRSCSAPAAGGASATGLTWDGDAGESIVEAAEAEAADLIVVGTHERGAVGRLFLGSVSDHVVRHARCPVHGRAPDAGRRPGLTQRARGGAARRYFVYMPSGSSSSRIRRSSAAVGAGVDGERRGDLRLPADRRPDLLEGGARVEEVEAHLARPRRSARSRGRSPPRTARAPASPARAGSARPSRRRRGCRARSGSRSAPRTSAPTGA